MLPLFKATTRTVQQKLVVFVATLLICPAGAQNSVSRLHSFTAPIPTPRTVNAALVGDTNGYLYGVSFQALLQTNGTVFRLKTDGNNYKVLHEFEPAQGSGPSGPLEIGRDGMLYGTTLVGGSAGEGTLFRIERSGAGFEVLQDFGENATAPSQPGQGLTLHSEGKLYGVTLAGGRFGGGVVYSFDSIARAMTNLHEFGGSSDGIEPSSRLFYAADGYFYGTTIRGGVGNGTIYRIRPDGSNYRRVY
jgi:uncharacterized repeat protein (TIGR03803 family)